MKARERSHHSPGSGGATRFWSTSETTWPGNACSQKRLGRRLIDAHEINDNDSQRHVPDQHILNSDFREEKLELSEFSATGPTSRTDRPTRAAVDRAGSCPMRELPA
jgi:hypothetical protein